MSRCRVMECDNCLLINHRDHGEHREFQITVVSILFVFSVLLEIKEQVLVSVIQSWSATSVSLRIIVRRRLAAGSRRLQADSLTPPKLPV